MGAGAPQLSQNLAPWRKGCLQEGQIEAEVAFKEGPVRTPERFRGGGGLPAGRAGCGTDETDPLGRGIKLPAGRTVKGGMPAFWLKPGVGRLDAYAELVRTYWSINFQALD
jgi:hypothetical protein